MTSQLKNIASITTGYYRKPDPIGNAIYLHGSHFDQEGNLKEDAILSNDILLDDRSQKHLLQDRDILFIAKGDNNRACMYYAQYGKAVASSLFFVIRANQEILLPEYLRWYINTPSTQKKLELFSRGSHIPSISKKLLRELEVLVPPLPTQQQILNIDELRQQEKQLTQQLLTVKERYYQQLLINLAKDKSE